MPRDSENTSKSGPAKGPRKTYCAPVLVEYGDIRELTGASGMVNMDDGMTTGNTKTS